MLPQINKEAAMVETSIDRRFGHTRVAFQESIRLLSPNQDKFFFAQADNLSESGMFVSSNHLYSVGTELVCDVPLQQVRQSLVLRGRVAWVKGQQKPGMGIEFLDLSHHDSSILRQAVQQGQPLHWARKVKVWFEGSPQPARAQAYQTPQGVMLVTELSFLRLQSPVLLSFPGEDQSCSGILQDVALRSGPEYPTPRLQMNVLLPEPLPLPGQRGREQASPLKRAVAELAALNRAKENVQSANSALHEFEVDMADEEIQPPVSGSINARDLPSPAITAEPSVETAIDVMGPSSTAAAQPSSSASPMLSQWGEAVFPDLAELRQKRRDNEITSQERALGGRRHLWLWLAALFMAGLALASMAHTQLWSRTINAIITMISPVAGSSVSSPRASSAKGAQAAPTFSALPQTLPQKDPTGLQKKQLVPPGPSKHHAADESADGTPFILREENKSILIVPISGSIEGASHYQLAKPDAMGVNLPRAIPRAPYDDYLIHQDGFRLVWIRKRWQGGAHIRIFFKSTTQPPKLELDAKEIRMTLTLPPENEGTP